MNEFHGWLTLTVFLPAAFALLVALVPKSNLQAIKGLALGATLVTLAVSLFLYVQYDASPHAAQFQIVDKTPWIASLHIN